LLVTSTGLSFHGPLNAPRQPLAVMNRPGRNCVSRVFWADGGARHDADGLGETGIRAARLIPGQAPVGGDAGAAVWSGMQGVGRHAA
jgi:hypothetical protein